MVVFNNINKIKSLWFQLHFELNIVLGCIIFSIFFSSCYTSKSTLIFDQIAKDTVVQKLINEEHLLKINIDDEISLYVSSLNQEMNTGFNSASREGNSELSESSTNVFRVNHSGEINIHYLGYIQVSGMTANELKTKLENDLLPYMREPIVSVRIINKKVTVMGEVAKPGYVSISDQHVSLLDVLVNCGNLNDNANAADVLVIRDSAQHKIIKHINLEDHSLFSSSCYYVRPDDIIYVKKNSKKIAKELRKREVQTVVSLVTSVFSLGLLVYNILLKK